MKKLFFCCCLASLFALPAQAQNATVTPSCGSVTLTGTQSGLFVDPKGKLCTDQPVFASGATAISGNASGTTGAVVGTLAAAAAKLTYLCDFDVSALGSANTVGPIVVAGLLGGSRTFQASTLAAGIEYYKSEHFNPCLPASAVNTAITITTTAAAGGTAVNVNSSGFQQ